MLRRTKPSRWTASDISPMSASSFPTRAFTTVSQSDTTLMRTSLPGSSISSRAWGPSWSSSASHQSRAWVSRRSLTPLRLPSPPIHLSAGCQSRVPFGSCRGGPPAAGGAAPLAAAGAPRPDVIMRHDQGGAALARLAQEPAQVSTELAHTNPLRRWHLLVLLRFRHNIQDANTTCVHLVSGGDGQHPAMTVVSNSSATSVPDEIPPLLIKRFGARSWVVVSHMRSKPAPLEPRKPVQVKRGQSRVLRKHDP